MAKFNPPWASVGGVARSPTVDEQNDGFSCGAADLTLFNRKLQGYDAELAAILDEGGITGTEADDTGVLQAIQAMIAAATGGGDTSQFVLFSQAQARLPIFPEVTTNNGVIAVTDLGAGNIRIPASATILHRGIRTYTTVQTDFATDPSKTYHLRWNPTDGFSLKDLASGTYNPTTAAETNVTFDSAYDDALISRIVTNSSNVPTITNLTNKARVLMEISDAGVMTTNAATDDARRTASLTFGLARTPVMSVTPVNIAVGGNGGNFMTAGQNHDHDFKIERVSFTRYGASLTLWRDYAQSFEILATITA